MRRVLGQGSTYPLRFEAGEIVNTHGLENVMDSIRFLLDTPAGNRFFLPAFGTRVHHLLFEGMSSDMLSLVKLYVEEDMLMWIPRIERVEATPTFNPERSQVLCNIVFWLRGYANAQSMVYPFYLNGETP